MDLASSRMKLGIAVYWRGATIDATREISKKADRAGFDYLWITEAWGMEALSTIGYLLGITEKIKIGPGVLNVYSRSASLIGMWCATINQISPGRFMLGLGSSGKALVEDWHGIPFDLPIKRTVEYVDVIRKVARGELVDHNGEVLKLSRFRLFTRPLDTSPEIYLGAIGDRNLKLAGEIADGAIVTMYPISKLSRAVELVAGKEGRKDKLVFAYLPTAVSSDRAEKDASRLNAARHIVFYVSSMGSYYAKNLSKLGFDESVKKIVEAHKAGGSRAAADAVGEDFLSELSLVGNIEEISERLRHLPPGVVPVLGLDADNLASVSKLRLDLFEPLLRS